MNDLRYWSLWVYTPGGFPVTVLYGFSALTAMVIANDVGEMSFKVNADRYPPTLFPEMACLELYGDAGLFCNRFWLVTGTSDVVNTGGQRTFEVYAVCSNAILASHVVAYRAASSQSLKTGGAASIMRQYVSENLGSGAVDMLGNSRDMSSVVYIDTLNWTSPTVTSYEASGRNLLTVCQDLVAASLNQGTYVAFDVKKDQNPTYRARVGFFLNQIGVNHGRTSNNPVVMSLRRGTISEVERIDDWSKVRNVVYTGGKGQGADRAFDMASDLNSLKRGIYGRYETVINRSSLGAASLPDESKAELKLRKSKRTFSAAFAQSPQYTFGKHFEFGDVVAVETMDGDTVDMHVDGASLQLSNGNQRLDLVMREA